MVGVQMRAHDKIDIVHAKPACREVLFVAIGIHHVPETARRSRLVVSDAAIDHDGVVRRFHDVALDTERQTVSEASRNLGCSQPRFSSSSSRVMVGKNVVASKNGPSSRNRWICHHTTKPPPTRQHPNIPHAPPPPRRRAMRGSSAIVPARQAEIGSRVTRRNGRRWPTAG